MGGGGGYNIYIYITQSPYVRILTGRQVENRFCTVLYRFLHLLQARPGGIFSLLKFTCVGESHGRPRVNDPLLSLLRRHSYPPPPPPTAPDDAPKVVFTHSRLHMAA